MNNDLYFKTITRELASQKDRLQHFIEHWLTVGEFRETIIRNVLRRHLPKAIQVGKGFIVAGHEVSTQIDILFYDITKPVLYQDGELLILTPDAALGAIEVKKSVRGPDLMDSLDKMADIVELTKHNPKNKFFGIFSYEDNRMNAAEVLRYTQRAARRDASRIINCISIGESFFVRHWLFDPDSDSHDPYNKWHAYNLQGKAPAYFLMNVVSHLCRDSVSLFDKLWFPPGGKEPDKIGEIGLEQ